MLEQDATVVESKQGLIWVEAISRSSCSQCSTTSCSTSVISKLFGLKRNQLRLVNTLQAKAGDQVVIGIPDNVLVKASLWAYLVPIISMVLATLLAVIQGYGDALQVLFALSGLATGFIFVGRLTRSGKQSNAFDPQLLKIKGQNEISVNLNSL
jgi:sigma-E factor negative regulatory protein RseC